MDHQALQVVDTALFYKAFSSLCQEPWNQGEPPAPAWARSARLFDAVVESF
jgi:hypothetical protein